MGAAAPRDRTPARCGQARVDFGELWPGVGRTGLSAVHRPRPSVARHHVETPTLPGSGGVPVSPVGLHPGHLPTLRPRSGYGGMQLCAVGVCEYDLGYIWRRLGPSIAS